MFISHIPQFLKLSFSTISFYLLEFFNVRIMFKKKISIIQIESVKKTSMKTVQQQSINGEMHLFRAVSYHLRPREK